MESPASKNLLSRLFVVASNITKLLIDLPFYLFVIISLVFQAFIRNITRTRKSLGPTDKILVTGAASGIGQHTVYKLAKLFPEATYILWDINEAGLKETESKCWNDFGARDIHTFVVDLSKKEEIAKNAAIVRRNIGKVNILWNNAGVAAFSTFLDGNPDHHDFVIKVNLLANMWMIREFLPDMVAEGKGHLVSTCSATSFYRWRYASSYVSSKYGQRGFLDSLKLELSIHPGKPDITFSTFYPSVVATPACKSASWKPRYEIDGAGIMDLDEVAEQFVDGILKEKEEINIPMWNVWMLDVCYRILPFKFFEYLDNNMYRNYKLTNLGDLSISRNSDPLKN